MKFGFDRASNRKWRQNTVATALTKREDEFYTYDALNQVKSLVRGKLNAGKTGLETPPPEPSWEEQWNFDDTGNWYPTTMAYGYVTKENGNTTLQQNRTHNVANELATITNAGGSSQWPNPGYDAVGSFTTAPKPMTPEASFGLKWDAWNRMVEVTAGGSFVARWAYDGANRRVSQLNGEEFRHYYYSDQWQVLEEQTGDNAYAERCFIWGMRGVDDLVCRDRGSERLYALNDPANVTAIIDVVGAVQERYGYSGFGVPRYMDANFDSRGSSDFDWETLFGGYRYDAKTGLYLPRHRILHARLGRWLSRDPVGYRAGTNLYGNVGNAPINANDPWGFNGLPTTYPYHNGTFYPDWWWDRYFPGARPGYGEPMSEEEELDRRLEIAATKGHFYATHSYNQEMRQEHERIMGEASERLFKPAKKIALQVALTLLPFGLAARVAGGLLARSVGLTALSRLAARALEPFLERVGALGPGSLPYGVPLSFSVRLQRTFVTATKGYPSLRTTPVGSLLRSIPGIRSLQWEQGHIFIQQRWFRAGPSQWFPNSQFADVGLQRLGNAGWNLLPLPRGLNRSLGQRPWLSFGFGAGVAGAGTGFVIGAGYLGYQFGEELFDD